ncbi:hypothetical protein BJ138DRAFT_1117704 [Hygrophoropsis aurantiaca]|uniref:Uncharacterized protein n=1 Tax=Hygrophoropsis aurantiaca TaxID=72124 RepID=A0ACB7ZYW8_9AGAM|nr:hypothetical protein BJ138DRAFT_1117704 [Hygrophoropsis aurantiaca]
MRIYDAINIKQLIGSPGVGKTAILGGLASRIMAKEVPESLTDKHALSPDLASLIAGSTRTNPRRS